MVSAIRALRAGTWAGSLLALSGAVVRFHHWLYAWQLGQAVCLSAENRLVQVMVCQSVACAGIQRGQRGGKE